MATTQDNGRRATRGSARGRVTWLARCGVAMATSLVGVAAFAATANATTPAVAFSVSPVAFGAVTVGTAATEAAVVTNASTQSIYFSAAAPSGDAHAEYHVAAGTCVAAVAPGATCALAVTFTPVVAHLRAATLASHFVFHNAHGKVAAGSTVTSTVVGTGVSPTYTVVAPSAGSLDVGAVSVFAATLTNTSSVSLSAVSASVHSSGTSPFHLAANGCDVTLLPGAACTLSVTFAPRHTGAAAATLTTTAAVVGAPADHVSLSTALSGTGVTSGSSAPAIAVSPLNFGSVTVGASTSALATIINTSSGSVTFQSRSLSDPDGVFALGSSTCPSTVAAGASCAVTVTFTPKAAKMVNATFVVHGTEKVGSTSTPVSEQSTLSGVGEALNFSVVAPSAPTVTVGASGDEIVTVTNTSLLPLTFASASFEGAGSSFWKVSSACTGALAPGATCSLFAVVTPLTAGAANVTLDVVDTATVGGHVNHVFEQAVLAATAVWPSVTLSTPTFSATASGSTSSAVATLTSNSNVEVQYSGFAVQGTNAGAFTVSHSTCVAALAPGASCALTLTATASGSAGVRSATLVAALQILGTQPAIVLHESADISLTVTSAS